MNRLPHQFNLKMAELYRPHHCVIMQITENHKISAIALKKVAHITLSCDTGHVQTAQKPTIFCST
ncbi:hypothetical protein VIBC2010_15657 [Vibrio caribbeanicus ATCC BAA-2122]|uniref:Uncharacterized protein n=1 Tax=Vibrio caribbeanicus ATCC BAA-2122 TaxID=796620 RepID=E3BNV7_9VIBR|nr:hypothetical protein VIBC2010_15657 [Vibrio caribbeanicus ATCC BAA-2122]